jgi:hypothetical protein
MILPQDADIATRQKHIQAYVKEYSISVAIEGTGLPLCDIRKTYTDEKPVYDHLVRVYQFYRGYEYQQTLNEGDDF